MNNDNATTIWNPGESCFPFIKGRVALYAILRAAGIGEGDEVLIPGFTCFVVAAAVKYSGAKAVYYDIDPSTYNGDPYQAAELISPSTRALIVQHTFGVPMDLGDLVEKCRERRILLIEDCAHAMGAEATAGPVGTLGDAAFASLQWSKPVTSGLGGLALINNDDLKKGMSTLYAQEFREPSTMKSLYLSVLSSLYNRFYRPKYYWQIRNAYHWFVEKGVLDGSSAASEFMDPNMPADYMERFGYSRLSQLQRVLSNLPYGIEHRKRIAAIFTDWCRERGIFVQKDTPGCQSVHLRFPLLVEGRSDLLAAARDEKLEIGDWLNAPLHPQEADACIFGYETGMCPIADEVARRVINLPTHRHVDDREAERILNFLDVHEARIAREPVAVTTPLPL